MTGEERGEKIFKNAGFGDLCSWSDTLMMGPVIFLSKVFYVVLILVCGGKDRNSDSQSH